MSLAPTTRIDVSHSDMCAQPSPNGPTTFLDGQLSSLRVALYSHDTMGLGHMRRNLLIAQSLADAGATTLMIAGAKEANAFALPTGVDCLTLPALRKDRSGCYHSRNLKLQMPDAVRIRSAAIQAAIHAFEPDVMIVDKVPRGIADELMATLVSLRRSGCTRCVLGLRDVLDEKAVVHENWLATRTLDVIREYFDEVWVYGDARVFDFIREYDLPDDVVPKVGFTGYFDQRQRARFQSGRTTDWERFHLPDEPFNLCVVGGGQDGEPLASAFVEATQRTGLPAVLLTGPYMPASSRQKLLTQAERIPHLHVLEFVPEADWLMSRAARVVAMGGYNTASSILSFGKQALVVPRVRPRREQLLRARRFRDLGLLDMLHPRQLRPDAVADWLRAPVRPFPPLQDRVDINALDNIQRRAKQLARRNCEAAAQRMES